MLWSPLVVQLLCLHSLSLIHAASAVFVLLALHKATVLLKVGQHPTSSNACALLLQVLSCALVAALPRSAESLQYWVLVSGSVQAIVVHAIGCFAERLRQHRLRPSSDVRVGSPQALHWYNSATSGAVWLGFFASKSLGSGVLLGFAISASHLLACNFWQSQQGWVWPASYLTTAACTTVLSGIAMSVVGISSKEMQEAVD